MPSLKQMFHRTINKLGWKIEKYPKSKYLLDKLIKNKTSFKFVQIGANDGIRFDTLYFTVTANRCPGLVVEALPDFFGRLAINYADYPEVVPVNMAVHGTEKTLKIYRVAPDAVKRLPDWVAGIASFKKGHIESHGVNASDVIEEEVNCAPLMTLLEQYDFLNALYFQSDTEGFDAEVIKMINFDKFKPLMVKYESIHLSESEKKFCESRLQAEGYRVFDEGMDTVGYIKSPAFD
jgi:FkbM family methyltransferase